MPTLAADAPLAVAVAGAIRAGDLAALRRLLRDRGADLNRVGWNDRTPLDIAEAQRAGEVVEWLRAQGARSAAELR
jgi:uncharacterized protein